MCGKRVIKKGIKEKKLKRGLMKLSKKYYLSLAYLSIFILSGNLEALVVGSNSALTRQGSTTFPAAATDNTILGFTVMTGGFTLQDQTTTLTYDAFFPVMGDIILNGGTFYLNQDLTVENTTTLTSFGNIGGASHLISLASMLNTLGSSNQGLLTNTDLEFQLNGNLTLNGNIEFQGNSIINGNNNVLDLSSTASIVVGSNSTLTLKNITINGIQGQNISCVDDSGKLILDNVNWNLAGNYSFDKGSILFNDVVDVVGSYTFTYDSSQSSTINVESTFSVGDGMHLFIGRKQPNGVEPIVYLDNTSVLQLENCIFETSPNGIGFTKGKVNFIRDVTFEINSTSTANGIIVGDGTLAGDVFFELFPGSAVLFPYGHVTFDITQINVVQSHSSTAQIIREDQSVFFVNQSLLSQDLTLKSSNNALSTIASGKTLSYQNVIFILSIGAFAVNASQQVFNTFNLTGNNNINLISGFMPFLTHISNANNSFSGSGTIVSPVTLVDNGSQLIWAVIGTLAANVTMNGGTLALASDLNCAPDILLSGTGTVALSNKTFNLGTNPITWNDSITWNGAGGVLRLNAPLTLNTTWVFSGQCIIDGKGQTIDLTSGNIVVAPGSSLTLMNVMVKNVSGSAVVCADNTGEITFSDVTWIQNGNYNFTAGALQFKNQNYLKGIDTIFAYESSVTSTVLAHSSVELDIGFTFSYDPGIASQNLLQFIDDTSKLILNGATLHATITGLQLTKGTLIVDSNSTMESESPTGDNAIVNGITFGDDTGAGDFACSIYNGVTLFIATGTLNYRNTQAQSFLTGNAYSHLDMQSATRLNVYETLFVGAGEIVFENNTTLGISSGKTVAGSIVPLGIFNNIPLP